MVDQSITNVNLVSMVANEYGQTFDIQLTEKKLLLFAKELAQKLTSRHSKCLKPKGLRQSNYKRRKRYPVVPIQMRKVKTMKFEQKLLEFPKVQQKVSIHVLSTFTIYYVCAEIHPNIPEKNQKFFFFFFSYHNKIFLTLQKSTYRREKKLCMGQCSHNHQINSHHTLKLYYVIIQDTPRDTL